MMCFAFRISVLGLLAMSTVLSACQVAPLNEGSPQEIILHDQPELVQTLRHFNANVDVVIIPAHTPAERCTCYRLVDNNVLGDYICEDEKLDGAIYFATERPERYPSVPSDCEDYSRAMVPYALINEDRQLRISPRVNREPATSLSKTQSATSPSLAGRSEEDKYKTIRTASVPPDCICMSGNAGESIDPNVSSCSTMRCGSEKFKLLPVSRTPKCVCMAGNAGGPGPGQGECTSMQCDPSPTYSVAGKPKTPRRAEVASVVHIEERDDGTDGTVAMGIRETSDWKTAAAVISEHQTTLEQAPAGSVEAVKNWVVTQAAPTASKVRSNAASPASATAAASSTSPRPGSSAPSVP